MRVRVRDPRDFLSGVLFALVGLLALVIASDYPIGTARRMGPGFLPMILAGLLTLLGTAITLRSLTLDRTAEESLGLSVRDLRALAARLRPLVVVLGALVAFALLVPRIGLVPSVIALVLTSTLAEPGFRLRTAVLLSLVLAVIAVAVFVWGIGLPFRLWP
jgi:hypothetical protein